MKNINKTKNKKLFYLILSSFLGLLLGLILSCFIERVYINMLFSQGALIGAGEGGCFISLWFVLMLLATGAFGGYFIGIRWWQIVYVEKMHWRCRPGKYKRSKKCKLNLKQLKKFFQFIKTNAN